MVKSPACKRMSPGGTMGVVLCVSEIHTTVIGNASDVPISWDGAGGHETGAR